MSFLLIPHSCSAFLKYALKYIVKDSMSKLKKMSFLFILLPWFSNELLWSMNKLNQGLWFTIWLSYIYIYIYIYIYDSIYIYMIVYIYKYIYIYIFTP